MFVFNCKVTYIYPDMPDMKCSGYTNLFADNMTDCFSKLRQLYPEAESFFIKKNPEGEE